MASERNLPDEINEEIMASERNLPDEIKEIMATKFSNLPDDVIIFMVEKLLDAKCLIRCCCVSKEFARVIPESRFISVPFTMPFFYDIAYEWPAGLVKFLSKFSGLEDVIIEFSFQESKYRTDGPLVKWRCDSNGIIILRAEKCISINADQVEATNQPRREVNGVLLSLISQNPIFDSWTRTKYIRNLLDVLPHAKKIYAFDSEFQGTIVVEKETIDNMRVHQGDPFETVYVKLWMEDRVELPLSGRVMKDVSLYVRRNDGVSDESMANNSFDDQELSETTVNMMKKEAVYEGKEDYQVKFDHSV